MGRNQGLEERRESARGEGQRKALPNPVGSALNVGQMEKCWAPPSVHRGSWTNPSIGVGSSASYWQTRGLGRGAAPGELTFLLSPQAQLRPG